MVNCAYCQACGTAVDEFEKICSNCKPQNDWLDGEELTELNPPELLDSFRRGKIEAWLDEHNHKMELMRTVFSLIAATTGIVIFLKVFEII